MKEVMEVLDKVTYERDLYASIEERREEMEAHMDITEKLTNEKKIDYKRTYLEMENGKELLSILIPPGNLYLYFKLPSKNCRRKEKT